MLDKEDLYYCKDCLSLFVLKHKNGYYYCENCKSKHISLITPNKWYIRYYKKGI